MIMGILSVPAVILNLFFVAFGFTGFEEIRLAIELLEVLFFIEIFSNFLTDYRDQETFEMVIQLKRIAIHYILHDDFFLHILAAFPYQLLTRNDPDPEEHLLRNWLMLKMLRLGRMTTDFIPDENILVMMRIFLNPANRDDKIANDRLIINVIKIIKQIMTTLVTTYFLALLWYRFSDHW